MTTPRLPERTTPMSFLQRIFAVALLVAVLQTVAATLQIVVALKGTRP